VTRGKEQIVRKYERLEAIEKNLWALEGAIETTKRLAAIRNAPDTNVYQITEIPIEALDSTICKKAEGVKGDAEQEPPL